MKEGEGRLSLSLCNSSSTITFSSSSKGDRNQEHLHTPGSKPLNNNMAKHCGKEKASLELKKECLPELHFSSHCLYQHADRGYDNARGHQLVHPCTAETVLQPKHRPGLCRANKCLIFSAHEAFSLRGVMEEFHQHCVGMRMI